MADNFDKAAILGSFFDEVDAYIPEIEAHLDQLQQAPDDETAIEEAYRRAHTIYGSAAMMSFGGLSTIAQGMEAILDDALERRATLDQPTIALLRRSCGRLMRVAQLVRTGADDSAVLAEDQQDHAAYRGPAAAAAQMSGGGEMPTQGAEMSSASAPLPDWLAAFGPMGAPASPPSTPNTGSAGGAFLPQMGGNAPSFTPSQSSGAFGQSATAIPASPVWGQPAPSLQANTRDTSEQTAELPASAMPDPREWATSLAGQPPILRPAPTGAALGD